MERVLLFVSLVVGLLVYVSRFLPQARVRVSNTLPDTTQPTVPSSGTALLVNLAFAVPLLGFLATLPSKNGIFADGQHLGLGFLIGGIGALLAGIPTVRAKVASRGPIAAVSSFGAAIFVVAVALLTLRASLYDGLMGVAIGWFCTTFPLLLALSPEERIGISGRVLTLGTAMTAALSAAAMLGSFRDPLSPLLEKLTWSATLTAFTALGSLVAMGTLLLPSSVLTGPRRLLPLGALILLGGLTLFQIGEKVVSESRLLYLGMGGLLLWPVALAALWNARRPLSSAAQDSSVLATPFLATLVILGGAMATLQTFQGVGIALFTLSLLLAIPVTAPLLPALLEDVGSEGKEGVEPQFAISAISLGVFAVMLLLWRAFAQRWTGDLRGISLTDQYALFGFVIGVATPALLAVFSERWRNATSASGIAVLLGTAVLTLAIPGVVMVLFGPKCLPALLIGLAVGIMQTVISRSSLIPAFLAMGVAIAIDQFSGKLLPLLEITRATKLTWLGGIVLLVTALVVFAERSRSRTIEN